MSGNTVNTGEFFDKSNLQGKIYFGKYCNNVDYSDNEYTDGGFLNSKKQPKPKACQSGRRLIHGCKILTPPAIAGGVRLFIKALKIRGS